MTPNHGTLLAGGVLRIKARIKQASHAVGPALEGQPNDVALALRAGAKAPTEAQKHTKCLGEFLAALVDPAHIIT
jgi:hypothetical protein